jgi:catechol 2,3-dioxygenase-like lactoylglutathione lyase family enzyme
MDMKLEVVPIPVRDVDAAKDFYTRQVGFRLDHDVQPNENMRVVQMTPPGSACSVVIGEGLPLGEPGSVKGVQLVVEDLDAVRSDLAGRGVNISGVYRYTTGLAYGRTASIKGLTQGSETVRILPRGTSRTDPINNVDFRVEKTFPIGSNTRRRT